MYARKFHAAAATTRLESLESRTLFAATSPLSALPVLESRPGATHKLYLDFNGDDYGNKSWGSVPYHVPGVTPAYDRDGDPSSYTSDELDSIREIWSRVAEKYSPFNLNVSTVSPGSAPLNGKTFWVIIGGAGNWYTPGNPGVAQLDGFTGSGSNVGWVFSDDFGDDPKQTAEAAAHEAGHGFGLEHQSLYDSDGDLVDEYFEGDADRAPVMGNSYTATRGLWWKGTTTAPYAIQDDMARISRWQNGFGYRPDDHTTVVGTPLLQSGAFYTRKGVIEKTGDTDWFRFENKWSDAVTVKLDVAPFGPTLDAKMEIWSAGGSHVKTVDTSDLGEQVKLSLPKGIYRIAVKSEGRYGDVGQYKLNVFAASAGPSKVVYKGHGVQLSAPDAGTGETYLWDLDGDGVFGESGTNAKRGNENGRTPTFLANGATGLKTVKLHVFAPGGYESVAATTVEVKLPVVTISALDASASETPGGTARFSIKRSGPVDTALTVYYAVDGTAQNGVDYQAIAGSVTIPVGSSSAQVEVKPVDDAAVESNETVRLTLKPSNARAGVIALPTYSIGSYNQATATIQDNDLVAPLNLTATASPGKVQLNWIHNSSGELQFVVRRSTTADFQAGTVIYLTAGADQTTLADTGAAAGVKYYYQVRAKGQYGQSAWSNVASATGQPGRTR